MLASFFEYDPSIYFQSTGIVYWTCRAKDENSGWIYANATNRLELVTIIDHSPPVANYILINNKMKATKEKDSIDIEFVNRPLTTKEKQSFSEFLKTRKKYP